jgi:hypothetical protein
VAVQVYQLKEDLQNNHLRLLLLRMTKVTKGDCLPSKTRRTSHQVVVLQSSHKMMDKRNHQKEQRQQVL